MKLRVTSQMLVRLENFQKNVHRSTHLRRLNPQQSYNCNYVSRMSLNISYKKKHSHKNEPSPKVQRQLSRKCEVIDPAPEFFVRLVHPNLIEVQKSIKHVQNGFEQRHTTAAP